MCFTIVFYKAICQYIQLLKKQDTFSEDDSFIVKREQNQFYISQTFKSRVATIDQSIQDAVFSVISKS